jgi:crotonobetainyl-CoA:carnitine CoA-transferase CaiB-like acyl-CoA transferase
MPPLPFALSMRKLEDFPASTQRVTHGAPQIQRAAPSRAQLREAHPRLITVDISGYGESGPYREMKAYDLLVQCETGLASITGAPEQPGRVKVPSYSR